MVHKSSIQCAQLIGKLQPKCCKLLRQPVLSDLGDTSGPAANRKDTICDFGSLQANGGSALFMYPLKDCPLRHFSPRLKSVWFLVNHRPGPDDQLAPSWLTAPLLAPSFPFPLTPGGSPCFWFSETSFCKYSCLPAAICPDSRPSHRAGLTAGTMTTAANIIYICLLKFFFKKWGLNQQMEDK